MRMISQMTLLTLPALMLTACANCTQDPSQADFFCGVKNIAGGTYEHRQVALRSEAESAEVLARQRSDHLRTLQSEEASLSAEKRELQKKLLLLQADIDKQKRLLADARIQERIDQDTLMKLERQHEVLRKQLEQARNATLQEIEILKLDIIHLQSQIYEVTQITTYE